MTHSADEQLKGIIESGENHRVKIGTSPLAANAAVCIDPDRLFGRHLAVLGNTGSGKSCSVAGLIQWSLDASAGKEPKTSPNARFIVLDPNGEYTKVFAREQFTHRARVFRVSDKDKPLQVPLWFWNCAEWCSFTQASAKAQRPLLRETLRAVRNDIQDIDNKIEVEIKHFLGIILQSARQSHNSGEPFKAFPHTKNFTERLRSWNTSLENFCSNLQNSTLELLIQSLQTAIESHRIEGRNNFIDYLSYTTDEVNLIVDLITKCYSEFGGAEESLLTRDEDVPRSFQSDVFLKLLEAYAIERESLQYVDHFLSRIRTMLANNLMKSIIGDDVRIDLVSWLENYIGGNDASNGCVTVIDLSLVPAEIVHIVTAIIARMVLEALQRYRRQGESPLPTVLVMEEAHTFIKRYREDMEDQNAASICCQVFEKIAREGRKFGLGLVLSSQRPSELSPTVLSQCNTFLLHRISNDPECVNGNETPFVRI